MDTPRISDPQRIRALTHPLRLELIQVLADGPATATQCAELTGESVASCSFHLRMLAKYGFIEAGERRGREKPWQLTSPGQDVRPDDDPASLRAAEAMGRVFVEHEFDRIRRWIPRMVAEPQEWIQASGVMGSSFWATSDELAEVSQAILAISDRFEGRGDDPSLRPDGARPVRLFAVTGIDVDREDRMDRMDRMDRRGS